MFAKRLHAARHTWVLHGFDWHVFSYEYYPAKTSDEARNAYRSIEPCDFIVMSSDTDRVFGFRCHGKPPDRLQAGLDILIAPTSMSWTMAFTHEEPALGPYFAEA